MIAPPPVLAVVLGFLFGSSMVQEIVMILRGGKGLFNGLLGETRRLNSRSFCSIAPSERADKRPGFDAHL